MSRGYGAALAEIHDTGFGAHAEAAAAELLRRLGRAGHRNGLVIDLGCGSGILARAVSEAGYEVLGLDRSAAMLDLARRRAPRARFARRSFVDADLPPCVAVTAVGEVLGYAFDARAGREEMRRLYARAHGALRPGGLMLFDLAGPGRGPARGVRRRMYEGPGWTMFTENSEDAVTRVLTRRSTFFVREEGAYRRGEETHLLNLHDPAQVVADLRGAGFAVRVLRRYGDLRFPRGLAGFAASRGRGPG